MLLPWIEGGINVHTAKDILKNLEEHPRPKTTPTILLSNLDQHQHELLSNEKPDTNEQKLPEPVEVPTSPSRLYALVVGIDTYKQVPYPLKGCVADGDAVVQFLKTAMGVHDDRIKVLRNEEATRDNLIKNIRELASCDTINKGDPILIYYAGHGAEAQPPSDWPSGGLGLKIQMLVPYDFIPSTTTSEQGQGIPDLSLGILLWNIAKVKGDNITLIFDCCHSGSIARDPRVISRGFDLPSDYAPSASLVQELTSDSFARGSSIASDFESWALGSYVLLAGCAAKQTSKEEDGRGRFTKALLKLLESEGTDKLTYEKAIDRLPELPEQYPQCEGINKKRILFNAMASTTSHVFHPVQQSEVGSFTLKVGEAYGITVGTEFNVYAKSDLDSHFLGVFIADKTTVFSADLRPTSGADPLAPNSTRDSPLGYAFQIRAGDEQDLRISIPDDNRFLEVYELIKQGLDSNGPISKRSILPVERDDTPHVFMTMKDDQVLFNITDKFCVAHGITRMYYTVDFEAKAVFSVLTSAADFYWHLHRTSSDQRLTKSKRVTLECSEVVETGDFDDDLDPIVKAKDENLNVKGVIQVVADKTTNYGFKVTNKTNKHLYASLFFFDMSDLSITSYYGPNKAKYDRVDPCVPAQGSLTIGYGNGGHPPRMYYPQGDESVDIGFLKLFVSTEYVDLSHIVQPSPFTMENAQPTKREGFAAVLQQLRLWDSILVGVVQQKPVTSSIS